MEAGVEDMVPSGSPPNAFSNSDAQPPDFFISRAGADAAFAAMIGRILEDAGHRVILEQWDFANHNFIGQMHVGLESGARVIALLSPEYLKSDHCLAEAFNAIGHDPLNKRGRLIVMRVAECAPAGMFTALAYWDLFPIRDNATAVRDLTLAAIRREPPRDAAILVYWREARTVLHHAIDCVPKFIGRREDLAAIDRALWANCGAVAANAVVVTQAAVYGLGGIGKSVLAIQYAWENRERYAGVWLVSAQTVQGVIDSLIALGSRFIPGLTEVQDRAEAARAALTFIENGGFEKPWLLIYDNVEQPERLKGLTPRLGAQTLITTLWPTWAGRATVVWLDVFAAEEAVQFLLAVTNRADAAGAIRLAEALGRLPLALDHAAAFCAETGDSFDDYGKRLAQWIKEVPESADYPASVFATFSLAIERAATKCPEAEKLMAVFAYMAANDIPRNIVSEEVLDAMILRKAVAVLGKVSLLTVAESEGGPLVSMHGLVQVVMRERLEASGKAGDSAALAVRLVADAFPNDPVPPQDIRSWPVCERLYPHAITVLDAAPETGDTAEKTTLLLNQVALYLNARANYAGAEPLIRRALDIDEQSYGPGHPRIAIYLNNLAQLLKDTNRLGEAEPLMCRALTIAEQSYGPRHPTVAIALASLATLLQATNRLGEAEPLMCRALAINVQNYGPEHPTVARDLNNLAQLLKDTNRLGEAEPLMHWVLDIAEQSYGPKHPTVAIALNSLATLLQATNRLGEAEPLMRRALDIDVQSYGPPGHPTVARHLNNLAQLLQATNRLGEAEPLMRRALYIDVQSYGPEHTSVARDLNNLAQLLKDTNRLAEAEPLMRRALAIVEASLPDPHPWVQGFRANLAALLSQTGSASAR
jgi:tetratricopeptide (TPR) repeat protein